MDPTIYRSIVSKLWINDLLTITVSDFFVEVSQVYKSDVSPVVRNLRNWRGLEWLT